MRMAGIALFVCTVPLGMPAQESPDAGAVTKVIALEQAWNQAEQRKDTKALDALFDNALIYVDYDGSLKNKTEFLARVRDVSAHPELEVTESMTGFKVGDAIIVTGIYVARGTEHGRPYLRRGRFVDTWVSKDGNWVCAISQSTPILR